MTKEAGQTTILVVGLGLLAFAIAGVAIDGTRAFILRRNLQNAADSATVAGAAEIDQELYYLTGGKRIVLDEGDASAMSLSYLAQRGLTAGASVDSDPEGVYVVVREESPTTFLRLIGIEAIPVAVEAQAEPRTELSPGSTLR